VTTATTRTDQPNTSPATREPQVLHLEPGTLLVDANVRKDLRVDPGMIDSIRELGLVQPVVAVRTSAGQHRVLVGHRRTLAAIQAPLATIPVYVVADEATHDAAQIERLVTQWDENEHRAGLRVADKVNAVQQLAAFGIPAEQIAVRLRTATRQDVDAALAVAGSALARAATDRYDFLNLTQAAVVAEFQDDAEAVKKLIAAAATGKQFEYLAQRYRDARIENNRKVAFAARLREAGITVVDPDVQEISELHTLRTPEGEPLDPERHAQCPGHAAYVITTSGLVHLTTGEPLDEDDEDDDELVAQAKWLPYCEAEYVCTDPQAHGHVSRWDRPTTTQEGEPQISAAVREAAIEAQREAARRTRRELIANNAGWASAETVRHQWLRTFVTRKAAPKGTASFVATAMALDAHVLASIAGHDLACRWLGLEKGYGRSSALAALVAQSGEARAQMLVLAQALAAYEAKTNRDHWQKQLHQDHVERFLRFLQANGYPLSPVELLACGETPATDAPAGEPDNTGEQTD
jgi:ParB family chromosome partitioning protein